MSTEPHPDRIVEQANRAGTVGFRGTAPRGVTAAVPLAALLRGELPPDAALLLVGDDAPGSPLGARLVEAHDGATNLVVVASAPTDVAVGQVGTFAGLGRSFLVPRATLAAALDGGCTDEVELRWRLWNHGCVVVGVELESAHDAPGALPAVTRLRADRVPVAPYRADDQREATVPSLTIIIHGGERLDVLESIPDSAARPSEVLVVGDTGPTSGRIRRTPSVPDAIAEAAGAITVLVHADAVVDRESWARLLRRFDDERVEVVRSAYATRSGPARSERGITAVDRLLGAPAFAAARTRVLRKQRTGSFIDVWQESVERERSLVVLDPPVAVDIEVPRASLPSVAALAGLVGDAAAGGVAGVVSGVRAAVRGSGAPDADGETATSRPSVGLIGFSGHGNFGDELVLRAARELLEGVDVVAGGPGSHGTVLGGGTLLNADRYYQRLADRIDAPGLARLVLGTGVVSPAVKGWSEPLDAWRPFLDAGPVGLRGPDSVAHLRAWGYEGEVEVLGDPALAVVPAASPRPGLVVLAPIGASSVGQVEADDEQAQVGLLAAAARRWMADGHEVALLSAHPGDDRIAIAIMRELGRADLEVCAAGRDLDEGLAVLAAADLVVGARLHALVAAASAGTPFVGLAYRPKVLDFARSVSAEGSVAPIASWTTESLLAAATVASSGDAREATATRVAELRARLHTRAAAFVHALRS